LKLEKPLAAIYTKEENLCMEQTQFQFRGVYYQQTFGTAMGYTISPFLANLFLGHLENKLKCRRIFPRVWVRYVDDIFAVVRKDGVLDLLSLLNSQYESINIDSKLLLRNLPQANQHTAVRHQRIPSLRPTQVGSIKQHASPSNEHPDDERGPSD
jgi:hypothetical protein